MPAEVAAPQALAQQASFVDLRAPSEFAQGAPVGAINLPILTDAERHRIGITYKQQGNAAATKLGHKLVQGAHREARVDGWANLLHGQTNRFLYCWRGGQRSQLASQWLTERGVSNTLVRGGYKALRQAALQTLEQAAGQAKWIVLGGRTGIGKTQLLQEVPQAIDLEGAAEHRGSAFGATTQPQPTPISFEFRLAAAVLHQQQHQHSQTPALVVEDESRTIGRLGLPIPWYQAMQQAPVVLLEVALPQRVTNIVREYVTEPIAQGRSSTELQQHFNQAMGRIKKRLGGKLWQAIVDALNQGFANGDHAPWVELLLTQYYDPMYDYQLQKKRSRVVHEGSWASVLDYCKSQ